PEGSPSAPGSPRRESRRRIGPVRFRGRRRGKPRLSWVRDGPHPDLSNVETPKRRPRRKGQRSRALALASASLDSVRGPRTLATTGTATRASGHPDFFPRHRNTETAGSI